jgi:hypothetical protein
MNKLAKLAKKTGILLKPEIDDLAPLHAQSLFDRIVRGVRRQGYKRAEGDGEACMYRDPQGVRCFVGLVISDREYSADIEGQTVQALHESGRLFSDLTAADLEFLEDLQAVHDDEPPERWEECFVELAEDYGLSYPTPKQGQKK